MIKAEKKGNPHPKIDISKGRIQKEIVEFSTKSLTPPLLVEEKKMIYALWNEFCMIWVFWHLSDQDLSWKGPPPPKN